MHDLHAMYEKTYALAFEAFEELLDDDHNLQFYPLPPKMSDLSVISLAVAAESASVDSENWLFSKLNKDYRGKFPGLNERSRFNRRRRRLASRILEFTEAVALGMSVGGSKFNLVDSVPCPVVKNSRERGYRICKEDPLMAPAKGYSAVDRRFYIGYKLHLLTDEQGVFQDMQITPANVHDINFLKNMQPHTNLIGKTIVGDKGYISEPLQVNLFDQHQITLKVPYRSNQIYAEPLDPALGRKRRRIETQFSQLCDQFRLKVNYAKSFIGFFTRIVTKLAAMTILQRVNVDNARPLNHLKHAWA